MKSIRTYLASSFMDWEVNPGAVGKGRKLV